MLDRCYHTQFIMKKSTCLGYRIAQVITIISSKIMPRLHASLQHSRALKFTASRILMCTCNFKLCLKVIGTNLTIKKSRGSKFQLYFITTGLNFFP